MQAHQLKNILSVLAALACIAVLTATYWLTWQPSTTAQQTDNSFGVATYSAQFPANTGAVSDATVNLKIPVPQ